MVRISGLALPRRKPAGREGIGGMSSAPVHLRFPKPMPIWWKWWEVDDLALPSEANTIHPCHLDV